MSISIIWEHLNGNILKGLDDCTSPSSEKKQMIDRDLNHGRIRPGSASAVQSIAIKTFSWNRNGDPLNPVTNAGLWVTNYYESVVDYESETNKSFCDDSSLATFGSYSDAGGSHSATADLATLISWGDDPDGNYGLYISLDRGISFTRVTSTVGNGINNFIPLAATCMDVGLVDGQLEPGDRAVIQMYIAVPPDFTNPGIYLFNLGLKFDYTE